MGTVGALVVAGSARAQSALEFFMDAEEGNFRGPGSREVAPQYRPQDVDFDGNEQAGTIVIDVSERFLYLVQGGGRARRYGIGVGREGFAWTGRAYVGRKSEWPTWTPPPAMIRRQPELREYAGGMPGGPQNPLGARAMYLYRGGSDTLYRIHGTNAPWTIGQAVSSGCIRMVNEHVEDLYERVPVGTRVVVRA